MEWAQKLAWWVKWAASGGGGLVLTFIGAIWPQVQLVGFSFGVLLLAVAAAGALHHFYKEGAATPPAPLSSPEANAPKQRILRAGIHLTVKESHDLTPTTRELSDDEVNYEWNAAHHRAMEMKAETERRRAAAKKRWSLAEPE